MDDRLAKGLKLLKKKRDNLVIRNNENLVEGKKIEYQHFCNQICGMSISIEILTKIEKAIN